MLQAESNTSLNCPKILKWNARVSSFRCNFHFSPETSLWLLRRFRASDGQSYRFRSVVHFPTTHAGTDSRRPYQSVQWSWRGTWGSCSRLSGGEGRRVRSWSWSGRRIAAGTAGTWVGFLEDKSEQHCEGRLFLPLVSRKSKADPTKGYGYGPLNFLKCL